MVVASSRLSGLASTSHIYPYASSVGKLNQRDGQSNPWSQFTSVGQSNHSLAAMNVR